MAFFRPARTAFFPPDRTAFFPPDRTAFFPPDRTASKHSCRFRRGRRTTEPASSIESLAVVELDPFRVTVEHYQGARFEEALISIPTDNTDPYWKILKSRTYGRLGQNESAVTELDSIVFQNPDSIDLQLEVKIARVFPLLSLHQYDEAATTVGEAMRLLRLEHSIVLETELHYVDAALQFMLNNDNAASRAANRALSASDDFFSSHVHPILSVSILGHNRAKALQISALIHSRNKRYHEQARLNRLAIMEFRQSSRPDAYTSAVLKMNLSFYVRDLDSSRDEELLDYRDWPASLNWIAAEIDRSLSLLFAAQGRFDEFQEKSWSASELSASPSFKVLVASERSFINRSAFDVVDARSLLSSYQTLMLQRTDDDDYYRDALLQLAQELSIVDPQKSHRVLDRWESHDSSTVALRLHDDREDAEIAFARATIAKYSGANPSDMFFKAFETWNSLGYRKSAATAAIELAELTQDPTFAAYARREAELRPGSWLDLRVRRMNV